MGYRDDRNITAEVPGYRRMLAHVTPGRDQASVFFCQTMDLTETQKWMDAFYERTGQKMSLTVLFMAAAGRAINLRPMLNRYVSGHTFYQRQGVTVSVSAKKALRDGAKVVLLKIPVGPEDTPEDLLHKFQSSLGEGRSGAELAQEKEHRLLTKVPGFLLKAFVRLAMWLDRHHLLPSALVDPDPLYTSLVVANLGSVGLNAAYHHLYEWGNCPFFAVMGRAYEAVVVVDGEARTRTLMDVKYTFDERVEDGLACAIGLRRVKELMEDPAQFDDGPTPLGELPPDRV